MAFCKLHPPSLDLALYQSGRAGLESLASKAPGGRNEVPSRPCTKLVRKEPFASRFKTPCKVELSPPSSKLSRGGQRSLR